MVEWLLLLLVPVAVAATVLLFGFAGCDLVFKLEEPLSPPGNVAAHAIGADTIRLTWTKAEGASAVTISRTAEGETTATSFDVTGTSLDDTGLVDETTYFYTLRSVSGGKQSIAVEIQATTLPLATIFAATLTNSQSGQGNKCVVQRIEPVRLFGGGSRVRITVTALADGAVVLAAVTISRAAGPGYDAAGDLTTVATNVLVPAGESVVLPDTVYTVDPAQPLLVAFDIANPGNLAFLPNVPAVEAQAFVGDGAAATVADRPDGFTARDRIYLISSIKSA